jgi:hypothetical protein
MCCALLERRLFVLEILLEERDQILLAHRFGLGDQPFVDGDLVVFDLADAADDDVIVETVKTIFRLACPSFSSPSIAGQDDSSISAPSA